MGIKEKADASVILRERKRSKDKRILRLIKKSRIKKKVRERRGG